MADQEYTTKLRLEADLSGGVATEKQYDQLVAKAKELGRSGKSGAAEAAAGINNLSKTVGFLRKALAGFGVVGLFTGLISSINKIKESFQAAKKQADEMAKIQKQLDESKHIQKLAKQYDRLSDSVAKAAKAQTTKLDQIEEDVSGRRRLDKANMEAAKQSELEALDPNAEDYAEQKQRIEAKYSAMGANMEASNAREDIVLKRQRLGVEADIKDQEAAAEDANAQAIRAKIAQAKRQQGAAQVASVDLNEADKNGVMDTIGKTLGQLFTGNWGRMADAKTEEGDKIRQAKAKEAADAELRVAELQEQLRKSEEKAAALRKEAGDLRGRSDSMGTLLEASDVEIETARKKGDAGIAEVEAGIEKKRQEEEKRRKEKEQKEAEEREKIDDATRAKALLEAEKSRLEQQIAAQQQRKFNAGAAVFTAQGALNNAQANRDRAGAASAAQQLNTANQAALEVGASADRLIANLTEKLKSVNSLLNKASSAIEKNNSQRLAAQAEALTTN